MCLRVHLCPIVSGRAPCSDKRPTSDPLVYHSQKEFAMLRCLCFLTVAVLSLLVNPIWAEKVDMSAEDLKKTATHIVTGQVVAIYERTESNGDWKYTRFVAEVRVTECEKGDGVKKGDLVYIRYWRRGWQGKG